MAFLTTSMKPAGVSAPNWLRKGALGKLRVFDNILDPEWQRLFASVLLDLAIDGLLGAALGVLIGAAVGGLL
jgi:hypothetical protein